MADISPGALLGTVAGLVLGALKLLAELLKWQNTRRLKQLETKIPPSAPPAPELARPRLLPEHSPAVLLEAKHIELLRAKYQIEELEQALRRVRAEHTETVRRMRRALDEAAQDQSRLAAAVSEERAANAQLLEEMAELRKMGGPNEPRDDRAIDPGARRGVHGPERGGDRLRPTRRPGRGEGH